MTKEEIEDMAFNAGGSNLCVYGAPMQLTGDQIEQFAKLVAKKCAAIAEQTTESGAPDMGCETKAYATAAAIEAEFNLDDSLKG